MKFISHKNILLYHFVNQKGHTDRYILSSKNIRLLKLVRHCARHWRKHVLFLLHHCRYLSNCSSSFMWISSHLFQYMGIIIYVSKIKGWSDHYSPSGYLEVYKLSFSLTRWKVDKIWIIWIPLWKFRRTKRSQKEQSKNDLHNISLRWEC